MFVRRRPLMRAAMLGGVGYTAYRVGQSRQEQATQQQGAQPEAAPQPEGAPQPETRSATDRVDALSKLKELLDSGALSQEEFDAEKQRLLRGE
jgi:hypothetical protein